jgi:hypothetical protein
VVIEHGQVMDVLDGGLGPAEQARLEGYLRV